MSVENGNENGVTMDIVCKLGWYFNYDTKLPLFFGSALSWENELGLITESNWSDLFAYSGLKKFAPVVRNYVYHSHT